MDKKTLYYCIEWGITLAACGYLVYRLVNYDAYPELWETLRAMSLWQGLAIAACVALMPVNMALEAWRWKTLIPMSWREAQRQVYYSKLAGLITPWRLGEYPARGLLMEQNQRNASSQESQESVFPQVLSMGAVGSATMTAAIVFAGVVTLAFSPRVLTMVGNSYLYALAAVVLVLAIVYLLLPKALKKYASVNSELLLRNTLQSLVRLACWCLQLYLVLFALGALQPSPVHPFTFHLLPIYYLLVTITPNVPIAEVGIRGAWAIALFGSMNAALAGVLLWVINTLLPCLIGPILRKKQ